MSIYLSVSGEEFSILFYFFVTLIFGNKARNRSCSIKSIERGPGTKIFEEILSDYLPLGSGPHCDDKADRKGRK